MTSSTHPQKNCFHCGLEVPEHLHLTVRFEDEEHETCCAGCQAVAQSIIDAGLGNYYKQRTADAEKSELPPPEVLSQLKLYDLPEVQADFVEVGAGDEREAQKERKQFIVRLAVAGLGMMQTMMFALPTYFYGGDIEPLYLEILHWGGFLMVLPVVFYSALPFYRGAWRDWKNRRVGMDTPIAIAIVMTFIAGIYSLATNAGQGMYFESIAMLLFFLLGGRFMEQIARRKAGDAAERLVKLVPAFCHRLPAYPESEAIEEAAVVRLNIGDTIVVKPGEVIPVDGTVLSGESEVNEAMLTGESLPIVKRPSEKVTAGTLNTSSPLIIRTDHTGGNTRLSHIVKLLDRALAQKPRAAELAEKYASSFVFGELLLAIPVFIGWAWYADAHTALWITVALLVITCPCALSLATPTALAASTGALAKDGILISGKQSLETLAQIDDVVFDKTGTLTKGQLSVSRMLSAGRLNEAQALAVAQALEQQSEHPIARAILNHTLSDGPVSALDVKVRQRVNRIGHGVSAQIEFDGETQVWALGKAAFVSEIAGNLPEAFAHIDHTGGIIFLSNQSGFQTAFLLEDQIKDSAAEMLHNLKQHGIRLHLLSGDRQAAVTQVAQELGLDAYCAEATPEDKLAYVENLQKQGRKVMMIGDGINDAPVLAQADVSAAVATSADVARDGADVVLLNDDLNVLPVMMEQARRTHQIIRQNLTWASAYNLVAVPLAVFGYVTPWIAALGMSFSSLLVLGNALRLLKTKKAV